MRELFAAILILAAVMVFATQCVSMECTPSQPCPHMVINPTLTPPAATAGGGK